MRNKSRNPDMDLTRGDLRWGRTPVGFLAEHVADALGPGGLPGELSEVMNIPDAQWADLTWRGLSRLPSDAGALDRIGDQVVAVVADHIFDLLDDPLAISLPADPELALRRWPIRPKNALLTTGLVLRKERLRSATVRDLIDIRNVGVRTVLQVTALLEASALLDPEGGMPATSRKEEAFIIGESDPHWGQRGAPLLPETLRRAFGGESLPTWLTRDLGLSPDATTLALDASVWKRIEEVPPRVIQYLVGLINYRAADISDVLVLREGWRGGDPARIAWPTRIQNGLARAGLFDQRQLGKLTYGALLSVPSLGPKSVLEFGVMAEQVSLPFSRALTDEQQEALLGACHEPWAERVRPDDPRFRDIAPAYDGTLSELFDDALANPQGTRSILVAESLPAVRARIAEIDAQPLDLALPSVLAAEGITDRDIEVTVRRMGWGGAPPEVLEEIGEAFGMTRERVRQIVRKSLRRMGPLYVPALERAIDLLNSVTPLRIEAAAKLLADRRISRVPFHPAGVESAAEVFGYEPGFQVTTNRDGFAYIVRPDEPGVGSILAAARREAGKVGASNVEEVAGSLEADGATASAEMIRRLLANEPRVQFLVGDWFWMPDIPLGRDRLRNQARKMLSVTPRLQVATIRQGLRRRYRFLRIDVVPPLDVLRALFDAHNEFEIDENDMVSSVEDLDYRDELGETERVFVEVLRSVPSGLLDRAELEANVTGRGVNPNTFAVFTTFSPILDHPTTNVWCLRGHEVDPASMEALRDILATRPRPRRMIAYGWEEDGTLSVTTVVSNVSSPVIGIPRGVSRYVAGRQFLAMTQDDSHVGTVVVDEQGASWGYGPFLRRRGAEAGDVLTIRFDLVAERATLVLTDEIDLEE